MRATRLKAVIFDFDGVLADSFPSTIAILSRLLTEEGHEPPTAADVAEMRKLDTRTLLTRSPFPMRRLPSLIRRVRREMAARAAHLDTFPGMNEAVTRLVENGLTLGIVTSNSEDTVRHFLRRHGWQKLFSECETGSSLFGKNRLIDRWLKRRRIQPEAAAYVGDETRDIDAARKSRVLGVAAGWGFAAEESLWRCHPNLFVRTPTELPAALLRSIEMPGT